MIRVGNDWQKLFDIEQEKPYYLSLRSFLKHEYATEVVFPPMDEIFQAFRLTPLSETKVVLVGQDPYHEDRKWTSQFHQDHEGNDNKQ